MSSNTHTNTYTVADIRKVVDNLAADISMLCQATGLWSREEVSKTVSDIKIFSEHKLITDVKVILKNSSGTQIRAAVYRVSVDALNWTSDRPGNNLWPQTPDGSLLVVCNLVSTWWNSSEEQRRKFGSDYGLNYGWGSTTEDLTFKGLQPTIDRRYTSNGYGLERTSYS